MRRLYTANDRVRYSGKVGTLERICGTKHLEVIQTTAETATVKHSKWLVTQTVPLSDLRRRSRREIGSDEMLQLWLKYTEFQARQLSPSTIQRDYGKIAKRLCLMPDLPNAVAVRDWLTQKYATEVVRRTLQQFSACCAWSVRSGYITADPFALLVGDFRKKGKGDRRSFTALERDAIINAFALDTYCPVPTTIRHSYYTGFVRFLFLTGCSRARCHHQRFRA